MTQITKNFFENNEIGNTILSTFFVKDMELLKIFMNITRTTNRDEKWHRSLY